jgi:hypothetical protein
MRTAGAAALVALTAAVLFSGCAGSGGDGDDGGGGPGPQPCESQVPGDPVSFTNNIQPIFGRSCAIAGCHIPPVLNAGLDMSPAVVYANTVNVKSTQRLNLDRIEPGDPDRSYLLSKMTGQNIIGVFMPQGCPGAPLNGAQCPTPDEIEAIRTWILECAPAN